MIRKNLVVENAHIAFRNFSGKESKFNRAGNRNFSVIFDKETGEDLKEQGWNVGILKPRDEYDEPSYKLAVSVQYGKFPPKIYMVSGRKKTLLDEHTVGTLDFAEIDNVDLVIRPYNWEVNGKTGVKAYVQTMYVQIREDKFAAKYDFEDFDDPIDDGDAPF
jgi:hypothetical protein